MLSFLELSGLVFSDQVSLWYGVFTHLFLWWSSVGLVVLGGPARCAILSCHGHQFSSWHYLGLPQQHYLDSGADRVVTIRGTLPLPPLSHIILLAFLLLSTSTEHHDGSKRHKSPWLVGDGQSMFGVAACMKTHLLVQAFFKHLPTWKGNLCCFYNSLTACMLTWWASWEWLALEFFFGKTPHCRAETLSLLCWWRIGRYLKHQPLKTAEKSSPKAGENWITSNQLE